MTSSDGVLVRARQLRKDYGHGEALVRAVDDVDLEVGNSRSTRSDSLTGQTTCPPRSPAASANEWRSPGRLRTSRS
jgi:hypothetical protein